MEKSFIVFRVAKISKAVKRDSSSETLRARFFSQKIGTHCLGSFRRSFVQASESSLGATPPRGLSLHSIFKDNNCLYLSHLHADRLEKNIQSRSLIKYVVVNVEEILQSRNFQKLKYLQITISDFKAK